MNSLTLTFLNIFCNTVPVLYFILTVLLPLTLIIMLLRMITWTEFKPNTTKITQQFALGDRMKYYEEQSKLFVSIPANMPFIVRLDGWGFSKFSSKNKQSSGLPYSTEFKRAMLKTTMDLQKKFNASTAYTHSDEITLIFPTQVLTSNGTLPSHIFNGKSEKLLSIIPSFASVSFDRHLKNELTVSNIELYESVPSFDARLIAFPNRLEHEIVNHMIWRSKGDGVRNFVSMYAEKYIGKTKIEGVSVTNRIANLKNLGLDLSENGNIDFSLKHGVFMKSNGNSDERYYVFKNLKYSRDMLNFLLSKILHSETTRAFLTEEKFKDLDTILYTDQTKNILFDFPCVTPKVDSEADTKVDSN